MIPIFPRNVSEADIHFVAIEKRLFENVSAELNRLRDDLRTLL
jgi:hypothetical protein